MSHADIAKVFGTSPTAIKKIEEQALAKIRANPEHIAILAQYMQERMKDDGDNEV